MFGRAELKETGAKPVVVKNPEQEVTNLKMRICHCSCSNRPRLQGFSGAVRRLQLSRFYTFHKFEMSWKNSETFQNMNLIVCYYRTRTRAINNLSFSELKT